MLVQRVPVANGFCFFMLMQSFLGGESCSIFSWFFDQWQTRRANAQTALATSPCMTKKAAAVDLKKVSKLV